MKSTILFIMALVLMSSVQCNKTLATKPENSTSIFGRWQRYYNCNGVGTPSRYSYWFRESIFSFFSGTICTDPFLDYTSGKLGYWSTNDGVLDLTSDSLSTQNVLQFRFALSEDNDTLYLTDSNSIVRSFRRLPACYLVNGYCDGMIYRGRLGGNFQEAIDSLLKNQWEHQASQLVYDSTRVTVISDTLGKPYPIPCFQICIYQDSIPNLIHSCGDVIDSLGNWYLLEFCPD